MAALSWAVDGEEGRRRNVILVLAFCDLGEGW